MTETHPSDQTADELFQHGTEALSANRYKLAIEYFSQAATLRPDDIELHYWLGTVYWNREQGTEAIQSYRKAVQLDPDQESDWSLYALENLAKVYMKTDHVQEAKTAFLQALERETRPEWITYIHNQIAELDLDLGIYPKDENTVLNEKGEIIGGVGPGEMHTNRNFEIARHTDDPQKQVKYYRRAIETDPQMYQSYFNLGHVWVQLGRYEEAIPWLKKSNEIWKADVAANPNQLEKTDAHAFLSLCYLELGDVEQAQHHSQMAMASGDRYFWAVLYEQRVQIALGKAENALPVLEALAADNPEHAETLHALALAYFALDQPQKAKETLQSAIDFIPDNHPWMVRLREQWKQSSLLQ